MAWGGSCGCVWAWCGRSTWRPPCPPLRWPLGPLAAGPARRPGPAQGRSLVPGACRGPRRGRLERQLGPMQPVLRPVRGLSRWRGGRGNGLGGRDGLHGWHEFGGQRFGVAGCRLGLLSRRPNRDRRWWRWSRLVEPSESDIASGRVVALAPGGHRLSAIHRHWGGRRASHPAHTLRHRSQSGPGLRALGPRGSSGFAGGSRTRWSPVTAVTSCVSRKACTPSRASGAWRGGRGTGAAP